MMAGLHIVFIISEFLPHIEIQRTFFNFLYWRYPHYINKNLWKVNVINEVINMADN